MAIMGEHRRRIDFLRRRLDKEFLRGDPAWQDTVSEIRAIIRAAGVPAPEENLAAASRKNTRRRKRNAFHSQHV